MSWLSDDVLTHLRHVADWPVIPGERYRITAQIARGGMGTVYAAEDTEMRREVAIKLARDGDFDADAAERLRREARTIARLEHPGIVPVHDVGQLADGRVFYVMKRVRGRRLDEHFGSATTVSDRLRVFVRICETVAFAHANDVVHLDLKPQNVMVGEFGEVLILDWGIAQALRPRERDGVPVTKGRDASELSGASERTATAAIDGCPAGTPAYSAPEQAAGDIDQIGVRSDVFALGAILYSLLTGEPPIDADLHGRARRRESAQVPGPRSLNRAIPARLDAICAKALAWRPEDRYASALAIRDDVVRFQDMLSVSAYREGPLEWLARFVSRHQVAILLILAYLVMRILIAFLRSNA